MNYSLNLGWRQRALFALLGVVTLLGPSVQSEEPIRVAVFQGQGVGKSANDLLEVLQDSDDLIQASRITSDQIINGKLEDFDILVHPGGSGSRQGKALGETGRQQVRQFVSDGGGFLGVCAGSYLATNDYSWSLHLIDAKVVDRKHWARGNGDVQLSLSPIAKSFFGIDSDEVTIRYGQGPLLGRPEWDDQDTPDYESLAIYKTGIAENGAPQGVMPRTSAIVRTNYGNGRVFCFSPHPELTDGQESMINTAVDWLAGAATTKE